LNESLSLKRFKQIHRYFTLRDRSINPPQENESFVWPVDRVIVIIRRNFYTNWLPSSYISIDEAMIPFRDRSLHKVKMKNKPISEGYKVWVLADNRYVWDWLWHSHKDGPETIPKKGLIGVPQKISQGPKTVDLKPTFTLVIRLATRLRKEHPTRIFCLFLDNLFLNINVSQALLALNICCMGTT
jgi:Transposase IS4